MRFILMITAVVFAGLGILSGCQNSSNTAKTETVKSNTTTAPETVEKATIDDAPRITLEEAKKDFDAGNAVFVDTRAEITYNNEHIKGAINIPAEAAETRYKEIPTDKKIIAYCS